MMGFHVMSLNIKATLMNFALLAVFYSHFNAYSQTQLEYDTIKQLILSQHLFGNFKNDCDTLKIVKDKNEYFQRMNHCWNTYYSVTDVFSDFFKNHEISREFKELYIILRKGNGFKLDGIISYNSVLHEFEYEIEFSSKTDSTNQNDCQKGINDLFKVDSKVTWRINNSVTNWTRIIDILQRIKNHNIYPSVEGKTNQLVMRAFVFNSGSNKTECRSFQWYQ